MGSTPSGRRKPGGSERDQRAPSTRRRLWTFLAAVSDWPAVVAVIVVVATVASAAAILTADTSHSTVASSPRTASAAHHVVGGRSVRGATSRSSVSGSGSPSLPRASASGALPAAVTCTSVASDPAQGTALRVHVSSGQVTAVLTGVVGSFYGGSDLDDAHIDVTDGARTVVDQPLEDTTAGTGSGAGDIPSSASVVLASIGSDAEAAGASSTPADVPLCLARFAGSAQPTVLVGLSSSGANCCTVIQMFTLPAGASTWKALDDAVGGTAATVEPAAGGALIVTADASFAGRFTDLAGSGMPVILQEVSGDSVVDVTAQHPTMVAADAARWWQAYLQRPQDPLGTLAAWAADECVLGRQRPAFATLDHLQQQGKLRDRALGGDGLTAGSEPTSSSGSGAASTANSSPTRSEAQSSTPDQDASAATNGSGTSRSAAASAPAVAGVLDWPQGSPYVAALRTFLVDSGYCSPS